MKNQLRQTRNIYYPILSTDANKSNLEAQIQLNQIQTDGSKKPAEYHFRDS